MRYGIIKPGELTVKTVECETAEGAYALAGLSHGDVDHGIVCCLKDGGGVSVVVYEFGLFTPPDKQTYFAIGEKLYAGNAVLYQFGEGGETVDLTEMPLVRWFGSAHDVEMAIQIGSIARPHISFNDQKIWQWPAPPPPGFPGGAET